MSSTDIPQKAPRRFEFSEGTSHKFWSLTQSGHTLTIRFGRIGTDGQLNEKEFPSEAEAARAAEKLIGEKTRKGYAEVTDGSAPKSSVAVSPKARTSPRSTASTLQEPVEAPVNESVNELVNEPIDPLAIPAPRINLEPEDWFWATWRDLLPLSRPAPRSFNLEDGLARLGKVSADRYGWRWDWIKASIQPAMSPEEASFWFMAITQARRGTTPQTVAAELAGMPLAKEVDLERLGRSSIEDRQLTPEVMAALASLFSPETMVERLLAADEAARASYPTQRGWLKPSVATPALRSGFRRFVLPYLTPEQKGALRRIVREQLDLSRWPVNDYEIPALAFFLAAMLGLSEELKPLVESWKPGRYSSAGWDQTHYLRPQEIVFGLGSASSVEAQMRRIGIPLSSPGDIRAWLAHTETTALNFITENILAVTNKDAAAALTKALALAESPETAPAMLELMLSSRAPRMAREWLDEHPGLAISGLASTAADRGHLSEAAGEFLRSQKRMGRSALIDAALESVPAEAAGRLRAGALGNDEYALPAFDDTTTPAWLSEATEGVGVLKMNWVKGPDLPAIVMGNHRLNGHQAASLLNALAAQKDLQTPPHPLIEGLKAHAEPSSCDAFAWKLFESWLRDGATPRDRWALMAVGRLGGDASALKLAPLVRAWPGQAHHGRAVLGLEVLRAIGTDTAIMQINGIAQKIPFKGLKAAAAACLEGIAQDRGLTRAELEDRIVPDCDLDERGSRIFDFGPRQFQFVLGPGMKPLVRDSDGRVKSDLPKPNSKDDPALAAAATEAWKLLKKQVAGVAKIQADRLEQAMVTGRRWSKEEFELLLVHHPLMTNLVRILVWGAWDTEGTLTGTFRLTEDLTYADASDETYRLPDGAQVGIVHPLQVSETERAAWGEIFGDYEMVPPFPQMGRAIHALTSGERSGTDITRFKDIAIPAASVVYGLDKRDWMRGLPGDGGWFNEHTKPFYGAHVTAVITYEEGVSVSDIKGSDPQKLTAAFFLPGIYLPHEYWPEHKDRLPLAGIDSVVLSEVLADLALIASKGTPA